MAPRNYGRLTFRSYLNSAGYWISRQALDPQEIRLVGGAAMLGGFLFALIVGWILVVFGLEHDLKGELSYIFLNGIAIGMLSNTVLAYLFLELRRQNQELQHTTEQLEQRNHQLTQQTGQLQAQNDRLDSFASIVSHDLRNPLSVAVERGVGTLAVSWPEDVREADWGKPGTKKPHTWAFDHIYQYLAYKGEIRGIKILKENEWDTSKTCSRRGECHLAGSDN